MGRFKITEVEEWSAVFLIHLGSSVSGLPAFALHHLFIRFRFGCELGWDHLSWEWPGIRGTAFQLTLGEKFRFGVGLGFRLGFRFGFEFGLR